MTAGSCCRNLRLDRVGFAQVAPPNTPTRSEWIAVKDGGCRTKPPAAKLNFASFSNVTSTFTADQMTGY